jgi:hypothetical protein
LASTLVAPAILLLIALAFSSIIIFVVTKLLGEMEGLGTGVGPPS